MYAGKSWWKIFSLYWFMPLLVSPGMEILAQEITVGTDLQWFVMGDRFYLNGEKISKKQVTKLISHVPKAKQDWILAKKHAATGWIIAGGALVGIITVTIADPFPHSKSLTTFVASGLGSIGYFARNLYRIKAREYRRVAISTFNQDQDVTLGSIGLSGIGFGIKINL